MKTDANGLSRRNAFVSAAGLSALAVGFVGTRTAQAAAMTAAEKANVEVVNAFMKAWGGTAPDVAKLASYVAEECFVTLNPGPPAPITTRAAVQETFKPFLANGAAFELEVLQTVAMGASVYVTRMDYTLKAGKRADAGVPAVGLFVLKDGKIKNWHDYAFTKA